MEQTDQYSLCAGFRPHFARDARAHFTRQGYQIYNISALYVYQVRLKQLFFESVLIVWLHFEGHIEEDSKKMKTGHGKVIEFVFN